jgi:allantoate deiminase
MKFLCLSTSPTAPSKHGSGGGIRKTVPTIAKSRIRAEEVVARCKKLSSFSEGSDSIRRTFLSPPMRDCHRELTNWLAGAGAEVTVDAVGNLRAFYAANQSNAPKLLLGSHLDTVPNAGAYDGVLGVVLAVALLEGLEGRRLPFEIELAAFSEEEGVRFGTPFIGSRALVGTLDENILRRQDGNGISIRTAIKDFGLDPNKISHAMIGANTVAYLEFHIEQGPVLDSLGQSLAVVEAIAGQTRMEFIFVGRANHAGTTPMHLRRDAIAAAAEWILAVERSAQTDPGLVATVGRISAMPGATNVIAGEARVSLDLRHRSDEIRIRAAVAFTELANKIAERRGLTVRDSELLSQRAVEMDPLLIAEIESAMRSIGCQPHRMVSGAGHDAMILAEKVPAAMIFLRTPGGISHDPAETVITEDVAKAIDCGSHLLEQLASSCEFTKRMSRA